jgi:hypothetical protein
MNSIETLAAAMSAMADLTRCISPDAPISAYWRYAFVTPTIYCGSETTPEVLAEIARTARKFGFLIEKKYTDTAFEMLLHWPHEESMYRPIYVKISVPREQVCTPKVIGKKTVKRRVYTQEEYDKAFPIVEVEEDDVEWDCHPLLSTDPAE